MWHPQTSERVPGRPIPGCAVQTDAELVVDGQQRITTLVMAWCGDLDGWRWNGDAWTRGSGYLTPSMAVRGLQHEILGWYEWVRSSAPNDATVRRCVDDMDKIARTDLDMMVLGGSVTHMVETYRRLATHGSPHSPEDLAVMEDWLAAREVD